MTTLSKERSRLAPMTAKQLRAEHARLFGEEIAGNNKVWMLRRILWRLLAQAEGGSRSGPNAWPRSWPTNCSCGGCRIHRLTASLETCDEGRSVPVPTRHGADPAYPFGRRQVVVREPATAQRGGCSGVQASGSSVASA